MPTPVTLRWARTSPRHVAHLTWRGFAAHGHAYVNRMDSDLVAACGRPVRDPTEFSDEAPEGSWRLCEACVQQLSTAVEQTAERR